MTIFILIHCILVCLFIAQYDINISDSAIGILDRSEYL